MPVIIIFCSVLLEFQWFSCSVSSWICRFAHSHIDSSLPNVHSIFNAVYWLIYLVLENHISIKNKLLYNISWPAESVISARSKFFFFFASGSLRKFRAKVRFCCKNFFRFLSTQNYGFCDCYLLLFFYDRKKISN